MLLKKHPNKSVDSDLDSKTVSDIQMRTPFATYQPVAYSEYEPFVNFQPIIDAHLAKLFAKKDALDFTNKNICDDMIDDVANQAIADARRQQVSHVEAINLIFNKQTGDRLAFSKELEKLKAALDVTENELAEIDARVQVTKFGG